MEQRMYDPIWNKYRPVILKLMTASAEGPQQYRLFGHEFKAYGPKERTYAFTLTAFKSKAVNNISGSVIAKNLLAILQESKTASELMDSASYEFKLDKQFMLHVNRIPQPALVS
jgi:hypothetical protein